MSDKCAGKGMFTLLLHRINTTAKVIFLLKNSFCGMWGNVICTELILGKFLQFDLMHGVDVHQEIVGEYW